MTVDRLTQSPLFQQYQWRSEAFMDGRWQAKKVKGIKAFTSHLVALDVEAFPRDAQATPSTLTMECSEPTLGLRTDLVTRLKKEQGATPGPLLPVGQRFCAFRFWTYFLA
jgi:hypothetical protein